MATIRSPYRAPSTAPSRWIARLPSLPQRSRVGVPSIIGKNYHGKPLNDRELATAMRELDATASCLGAAASPDWKPDRPAPGSPRTATMRITLPPIAEAFRRTGLESALEKKKLATRVAYGAALVALGDVDPRVVALDGDVSNSTYANMFEREHRDRFFECKIAEQNMISVAAGLSASGKIPPSPAVSPSFSPAPSIRLIWRVSPGRTSRSSVRTLEFHSAPTDRRKCRSPTWPISAV